MRIAQTMGLSLLVKQKLKRLPLGMVLGLAIGSMVPSSQSQTGLQRQSSNFPGATQRSIPSSEKLSPNSPGPAGPFGWDVYYTDNV